VGFVYKKSQNEIDKSLDLRFYMGLVGILALAMGFYIAGHPRPLVVVAIFFTVAVPAIVGLIATIVARASWKLDEGQVKSSPYACCESNHCANGLLAHTELSLEAAPKKTIGVTDNAPSAEQRAKRDKLNQGTSVGPMTFFFILFIAFLVVQFVALGAATLSDDVHLRTTKKDVDEQKKCATEQADDGH
jgi:hypothetical protein